MLHRSARNAGSFELSAIEYFYERDAANLRTGYSSVNTISRLIDGGGGGGFGSEVHVVHSKGLPVHLKHINLSYLQMEKDAPEQAAILWLGLGAVYVSGKNISKRKRAAMVNMSSASLDNQIKKALINWHKSTCRLITIQKASHVR